METMSSVLVTRSELNVSEKDQILSDFWDTCIIFINLISHLEPSFQKKYFKNHFFVT